MIPFSRKVNWVSGWKKKQTDFHVNLCFIQRHSEHLLDFPTLIERNRFQWKGHQPKSMVFNGIYSTCLDNIHLLNSNFEIQWKLKPYHHQWKCRIEKSLRKHKMVYTSCESNKRANGREREERIERERESAKKSPQKQIMIMMMLWAMYKICRVQYCLLELPDSIEMISKYLHNRVITKLKWLLFWQSYFDFNGFQTIQINSVGIIIIQRCAHSLCI